MMSESKVGRVVGETQVEYWLIDRKAKLCVCMSECVDTEVYRHSGFLLLSRNADNFPMSRREKKKRFLPSSLFGR